MKKILCLILIFLGIITHTIAGPTGNNQPFTGSLDANIAILHIETIFDTSCIEYQVMMSIDGKKFIKTGSITQKSMDSKNCCKYITFTLDEIDKNNIGYFKLRKININKTFEDSKVITITDK